MDLVFLEHLQSGKNLLAFSSGVDSSALYAKLAMCGIAFDVAIIDYGVRKQSQLEVSHAQMLCFRDNKKCFIYHAPEILKDFENKARQLRYTFFENLIVEHNYTHLILAHQLNDALEWFLMQFCKGSSVDLLTMQGFYKKQGEKCDYFIVRPLFRITREEILAFLREHEIFYFEDFSNTQMQFLRNFFREKFSNPLMENFANGIKFSLESLESKRMSFEKIVLSEIPPLKPFCVFKMESKNAILEIDRAMKLCGILSTRKEKLMLQTHLQKPYFSLILKHKLAIEKQGDLIFLSFYEKNFSAIPKEFKEKYRLLRIPKYFRIFVESARKLDKMQEILEIIQRRKNV